MKQRYATWSPAIAIIATMLGCGGDDGTGGATGPATGTPAGAAGPVAPVTGGAGAAAPGPGGGASGARAAGSAAPAPAAGSGTSSGAAGGSAPPTGAGGAAGGGVPAGGVGGGADGAGGAPAAAGSGAAGDASGAAGGGAPGAPGEPGQVTNCGSADNADITKGPGPFTPTHITDGGAGSSWVFYPEELGRDGCKHPIFNWGPGAGTGPSNYTDHLNHLASHGFVIISQPSSGNGTTEKASLEWLIKQNDEMASPFFQKLDTTKVVMGGHSMGALTTFAMADWEPLTHYILVCGGSFGAPTGADKIHGPAIILGGDTDSGTPNFEDDYEAIPTSAIFLIKSGTDHIACARNNLEPWTEFMRWQLYGETKWKADFFEGGKFCSAPWDSCESKNW
ncbi:MAG: hypothetical protein ABW321_00025 [Polyangiales bacterium]